MDETFLPPAEVVVARLPHFADMLTALMGAGSFKVGRGWGGRNEGGGVRKWSGRVTWRACRQLRAHMEPCYAHSSYTSNP